MAVTAAVDRAFDAVANPPAFAIITMQCKPYVYNNDKNNGKTTA